MDNGGNGAVVSSPDMQQDPDAPQGPPPQGPPPQGSPDDGGWQNGPPPPPPANAVCNHRIRGAGMVSRVAAWVRRAIWASVRTTGSRLRPRA